MDDTDLVNQGFGDAKTSSERYVPFLRAYRLPDVPPLRIVPAPARRAWMDATLNRVAYRCLPLTIANQAGWLILNDQPFFATWDGGSEPTSVKFVFPKGTPPYAVESHFGFGVLTWQIPYLFRTSPGYNLLVRGPSNSPKDGITPLEGVVETDWAVQTFTMNWRFTRTRATVAFGVDEPICMIVPQRRGEMESVRTDICDLARDPDLLERYRQFAQSRADFLGKHPWEEHNHQSAEPDSQRHYARGIAPGDTRATEHQTKLRLRPFNDHTNREL